MKKKGGEVTAERGGKVKLTQNGGRQSINLNLRFLEHYSQGADQANDTRFRRSVQRRGREWVQAGVGEPYILSTREMHRSQTWASCSCSMPRV